MLRAFPAKVLSMAKKIETVVTMTDDLDGTKADRTVIFGFDGVAYEIDLSKKNAAAFEKALKPYLQSARRVRRPAARTARSRVRQERKSGSDLAAVREWARANGHEVSDRGRLPGSVMEAYTAAH